MSISNLVSGHHKGWQVINVNSVTADQIQLVDASGTGTQKLAIPIFDSLPAQQDGTIISLRTSPTTAEFYYSDGTTWHKVSNQPGTGTVSGPGSSTLTAVPLWDDTTGTLLKNSGVLVDASNNVTVPGTITSEGKAVVVRATLADLRRTVWNDTLGQLESALDDQHTVWVSKNGDDGDDGLTEETAFLTITAAAAAAVSGDTVRVQPGVYTEADVVLPAGVGLDGAGSNLVGRLTLGNGSNVGLSSVTASVSQAVRFNSPAGSASIHIGAISCTGNANAIVCLNGALSCDVGRVETVDGNVIDETNSDRISLIYGTIEVTGTGGICDGVSGSEITLDGGQVDCGSGPVFRVVGAGTPKMSITASAVYGAAALSNIIAAAECVLVAGALSGALVESGAGNVKVLSPDLVATTTTTFSSATPSTSSSTGALVVAGGVAVGQDVRLAGILGVDSIETNSLITHLDINPAAELRVEPSGGPTVLSVIAAGADVTGTLTATGIVDAQDTTNAVSTVTGALKTAGGLGVVKDVWIGGTLNVAGATTVPNLTITGVLNKPVTIYENLLGWSQGQIVNDPSLAVNIADGVDGDTLHLMLKNPVAGNVGVITTYGSFNLTYVRPEARLVFDDYEWRSYDIVRFPKAQQGLKHVGTGATGASRQGSDTDISADGRTMVTGAYYDNNKVGAAHVFVYDPGTTTWSQQGSILIGTGSVGATVYQGFHVALSADGDTMATGGYWDNSQLGAVWVFTRTAGVWSQQGAKLLPSDGITLPRFGYSVDLSADGDDLLIGGPQDNGGIGATWLFHRTAGVWAQVQKFIGTGGTATPNHGYDVAISADGKRFCEGGFKDDSNVGAIWVWRYDAESNSWLEEAAALKATILATAINGLGSTICMDAAGENIVAGAPDNNGANPSSAYWFSRKGYTWTERQEMHGFPIGGYDAGYKIALSGNGRVLFLSCQFNNSGVGGVYVFVRDSEEFVFQQVTQLPSDNIGNSEFGAGIGLSADGSVAVIGGWIDNTNIGATWIWT